MVPEHTTAYSTVPAFVASSVQYRTQVAVAPQGFTITILRVVVDSSLMSFINHNPHRERIRVNPELKKQDLHVHVAVPSYMFYKPQGTVRVKRTVLNQ